MRQVLDQFFLEMSAGAECLADPCTPGCQKNIDRTMDACHDYFVPHTREVSKTSGILSMQEAAPSSCNYGYVRGRHLLEADESSFAAEGKKSGRQLLGGEDLTEPAHPDDALESADRAQYAAETAARAPPKQQPPSEPPAEQPPAESSPGGDCADVDEDCSVWAGDGECERNPVFMMEHCRRSCGGCGGPNSALAQAALARGDVGSADNDCADSDPDCPAWAASGECETNPEFMHATCKRSCKLC